MGFFKDDEEQCYFWLASKLPVCSAHIDDLIRIYGSAKYVRANFLKIVKEAPKLLTDSDCEKMRNEDMITFCNRILPYCVENKIRILLRTSDDYPKELKKMQDAPNVLYVRGVMPEIDRKKAAIVGTRKCTQYGLRATRKISGLLANAGVCIVSGMADGIDAYASECALEFSKHHVATIAVLAGGVDCIYPPSNEKLYHDIMEHGAIISEFEPRTKPQPYMFPVRNKIIASLASCVIVPEAGKGSGALITARYACSIGRKVFCVPGRVGDCASAGANDMIHSGEAQALTSSDMVLDFINNFDGDDSTPPIFNVNTTYEAKKRDTVKVGVKYNTIEGQKTNLSVPDMTEDEKKIYDLLKMGEKSFDKMCEMTGFSVAELNFILTNMELSRIIKQSPGRVYGLIG